MKESKKIILTPTQKLLFDAYQPMIDKAVNTEINRVIIMSKGCADYCTAEAQTYLSTLNFTKSSIEQIGRHFIYNNIATFILLYAYKTKVLRIKNGSTLDKTFDRSFISSHNIQHEFTNDKDLLTDKNKSDYKIIFSKKLFDKAIIQYEKEYRQLMAEKLERSITKYVTENFIRAYDINIQHRVEGYEVRCELKNKNGSRYTMYTRAINAGGHHIQCFHYRYITKITTD